jgi:hypothetical protein
VRLYVCWGTFQTFGPGHPCRNALDALQATGHQPQIIRSYGWGLLLAALNPSEGRRLARRETGRSWLPLLVTDRDEYVAGSNEIRAWAAAHPAAAPGSAA